MDGVNWLGIVVAAVAGFAFGAAWYTALSGPWLAALGKTKQEIRQGGSPLPFVIAALAQLVMAYMLACAVIWRGDVGVGAAMTTGFLVWLGFVLTTMAVNHGFQGSSRRLTLIDAGHWLGVLLVQGLVIGLFES